MQLFYTQSAEEIVSDQFMHLPQFYAIEITYKIDTLFSIRPFVLTDLLKLYINFMFATMIS